MPRRPDSVPPGVRLSGGRPDRPPLTLTEADMDALAADAAVVRELERPSDRSQLAPALAALRAARAAAGLTLAQAAARAGVAEETLCKLEGGKLANPTWQTLDRCAAAVGLTLTVTAAPAATSPTS